MTQIQDTTIKQAYIDSVEAKKELSSVLPSGQAITKEIERQKSLKFDRFMQSMKDDYELQRIEAEVDQRAEKLKQERLERQAAEKAEQERLERQAAEKAEQERLEQQAAEKAEQERLERQAAEKAEQERLKQEAAKKAAQGAIKKRPPFDLVNIRMESTVIDRHSRRKDNKLSGNVPIGAFIDHLLKAMRDGHDVVLEEGNNSHLANNKTAQSIKAFMLQNLSVKEVRFDYGNLGIEKFADKYALRCDISDLEKLNDINPPATVHEPQKQPQRPSLPLKPTMRNDDYDLGM